MSDGWCDAHRARISEADDAKAVAEALIVNKALSTGRFPPDGICWACALDEPAPYTRPPVTCVFCLVH